MDENKEKELLENEAEDKLSEEEKAEVNDILEKLKNQDEEASAPVTDWDGLAEVGNAGSDMISEEAEQEEAADGEETEAEETEEEKVLTEDDICIKCEQRERYTELDENYPYCKACRENMKKTRMNVWGVLTFIFVFLSAFVAIVMGVYMVGISLPVIKGDMYMREKRYSSAITCYEGAIESINSLTEETGSTESLFDVGNKTYAKLIKAYFLMGTPTYAQDYFSAIASSGVLEKAKYAETKEYYDIYDKMMNTYATLQQLHSEELNTLYASEKKPDISTVETRLKELEEKKADESYDKYMVAYYQYLFCSLTENSTDEGLKYLEEIKSGGRDYEFIYAIELSSIYLEKGEYEKAEEICYESLEAAPENLGVYQYLMKSKIRQGDYDAAIKLAEKAQKESEEIYVSEEGATALPHTVEMEKAIAYALKGDEKNALKAIEASYATGNDNQNLNIYILLHYLYHVKGTEPTEDESGEKVYDAEDGGFDEGMSVISYYGAYYGLSVSESINDIIDGNKTLEDVFVKGEVNWQ